MNIKHFNDGTINKNRVVLNNDGKTLELFFSYETIIGYRFSSATLNKEGFSKNYFSRTTSRYQNALRPDKHARIEHNVMMQELEVVIFGLITPSYTTV